MFNIILMLVVFGPWFAVIVMSAFQVEKEDTEREKWKRS